MLTRGYKIKEVKDYNTYSIVTDVNINGVDVDMQGDEASVRRITFRSDEYSYSVTTGKLAMDEKAAETLIADIINGNADFISDGK